MKTRSKITLLVLLAVIVIAGFVGWRLGRSSNSTNTNNGSPSSSAGNTSGVSVKSLIGYTLPDAWKEDTCSNSSNVIYIIPDGSSLNCSANPSAPIKIYVDSQDTTDCQQLMPTTTEGIRKHVCISLYISGHKSLKASTEYSNGSGYKTDTTISDYYINTGKGVVAIQYTYTSANDFQAGFDQLALSVKVK